MGVFAKGEGVMSARQGGLQVAKDDVQPLERVHLAANFAFTCDDNLVIEAESTQYLEAEQAVGRDDGTWYQCFLGPSSDACVGEAGHRIEAHTLGFIVAHLDGSDEGHLVLRAPAGLATGTLATQVGVVDTHITREGALLLTLAHGLHQLVVQQPGGPPGDTHLAPQRQCGNLGLRLGDQVDRQEPLRQGQSGVLHERPRDHRGLLPACPALPVAQRSPNKFVGVIATTVRAAETVWPTRTHQRRFALRFRSVVDHKSGQGHSLLKLDTVDRHDFQLCEEHGNQLTARQAHRVSPPEIET